MKAYPNPVVNSLTIEMFGSNSTSYDISIYSLHGALLIKKEYSCVGMHNDIRMINLSSFKRGTYIMKIRTSDGIIDRVFKIEKI